MYIIIVSVAFLGFLIGGFSVYQQKTPRYQGGVASNFDGVRFRNPSQPDKSFIDFLKWRMEAKNNRKTWPEWREIESLPAPVRDYVDAKSFGVTYVNHATVLIQMNGVNIITDPHWSYRASPVTWAGPKRVHDPGIDFDALPPIDVVLISHNHYDHLDIQTIRRLWNRDQPIILVPLGDDQVINRNDQTIRSLPMDWGDTVSVADNALRIHFVPVQHWSSRAPFDRNKSLWGGYVIENKKNNHKIYFAGDTGYGDGAFFQQARLKFGQFDMAILPIGAYEPRWFMAYSHMNPEEAVKAMLQLGAKKALGIHYGTFQLTDEGIDDPVEDLKRALKQSNIDPKDFRTLAPGENWIISPIQEIKDK